MRLTVTPLGSAGRAVGAVARAVVDYLEGGAGDPGAALLQGASLQGSPAVEYYADSMEGTGRWVGAGAAFRRLRGVVDRESFQRVLEGRHPTTGERLVTAQGSSQRGHLAVGTAARLDDDGQPLYTEADAARLLKMRRCDIAELVKTGLSVGRRDPGDASWIGSFEDPVDGALIPDSEITRHLELAAAPGNAEQIRAAGDAGDLLSVTDAARLLRVTPQYVRRLCVAGEQLSTDRPVASLPSHRIGDKGEFRIRRQDLAEFAERRKPPVARVGFDLTLTVEKSIGLVTMLSTGDRQETLVRALQRANDTAMDYLDGYASVARRSST